MSSPSAVPAFLCPGSTQPVSRSVHLARLNSAWHGCDQCEFRHDTEGLAERTILSTDRIRDARLVGLCRTEFGVRGQYINSMDRSTSADLARVFGYCLNENWTSHQRDDRERAMNARPQRDAGTGFRDDQVSAVSPLWLSPPAVVLGFDGRSSSPDIFIGVLTAVRELGLPVIDIGRSTAASLQEAVRCQSRCAGGIFVTGAGAPVSWTGLDVSDPHGDPLPVIWKDFGIRLIHVAEQSDPSAFPDHNDASKVLSEHSDRIDEVLHRLRHPPAENLSVRYDAARIPANCGNADAGLVPGTGTESAGRTRQNTLRLMLPDAGSRSRWMVRLSRQSGSHDIVDFESAYRDWLLRWFPRDTSIRVLLRSQDPLVRERAVWIGQQTGLDLTARTIHDSAPLPGCAVTMTVDEDDRQCHMELSGSGPVTAERLAALINDGIRSASSQITAHSDPASGRFWLSDSGRNVKADSGTSGRPLFSHTEHVRDALALLGLITSLIQMRRIPRVGSH